MASYLPYEPLQQMLLPEALHDWLPEGHLAYFVSDAVDGLDLSAFLGPAPDVHIGGRLSSLRGRFELLHAPKSSPNGAFRHQPWRHCRRPSPLPSPRQRGEGANPSAARAPWIPFASHQTPWYVRTCVTS